MRRFLLLMTLTMTAYAADVAGHYVLRNVMEVGSELLLRPAGTFEFMLAYGAADYYAKGAWRTEGGAVIQGTVRRSLSDFAQSLDPALPAPVFFSSSSPIARSGFIRTGSTVSLP